MSDSIAQEVRREAAREERYSRWRGKTAHATHYVAGLGAAVSAALAGYLANVDSATGWATLAGGVGAALAAIVTFMSPRDRAAFQYSQSADYGSLKRDTQLELARSGGPRDEEVAALSKRLADLHRRVAADLQARPPSESSRLG
jgi:hypothetical protein